MFVLKPGGKKKKPSHPRMSEIRYSWLCLWNVHPTEIKTSCIISQNRQIKVIFFFFFSKVWLLVSNVRLQKMIVGLSRMSNPDSYQTVKCYLAHCVGVFCVHACQFSVGGLSSYWFLCHTSALRAEISSTSCHPFDFVWNWWGTDLTVTEQSFVFDLRLYSKKLFKWRV